MADDTNLTFKGPLRADLSVAAPRAVPLCISLCEPICARSDYEITFDVFGNHVATITVRGMTRLFNCRDEQNDAVVGAAEL
jgi:hypothetical protein